MCCGSHLPVLWTTCSRMLSTTCTPQHIPGCPQYTIHFMLWVYVVGNTHLCCGAHVHECCPQHIFVVHNIWHVVENICRFSLCYPQHTPTIYKIVHNIHPQHMVLDMLWMYVVDNNLSMLWSTYVVEHFEVYRCYFQKNPCTPFLANMSPFSGDHVFFLYI